MLKFWTRSLVVRLVAYFSILSLLAVTVVPLVTYFLMRESLTQSVFDRLEVAASLKEGEVNRWVEDNRADIVSIAQGPEFLSQLTKLISSPAESVDYQTAYWVLSNYLNTLLDNKISLQEVFIMAEEGGRVVLSTDPGREGRYSVAEIYFTEGQKGTFVQNIYISSLTNKPAQTISTPLLDGQGNRIGVLAANLDLKRLDQIILERAGLGETGETYLVNKYNTFVSEALYAQEDYPQGVHTVGIDNALQGYDGRGIYENYQGIPTLGVYHWVGERGVALLAEIQSSEAFAPAQRLAFTIFAFGLGAVVLLTGTGFLAARQIARPILAINKTATLVAGGDLSQRAPVMTSDEIGTLSKTFNQMTAQLQDLVGTLEQRVSDRTRELERQAIQLKAAAEVGSAVTSYRNLDELFAQVTRLISERFGYYHVGIFLLDPLGEYAVLRASNSDGGQRMLTRGHKLAVGQKGIVGYVTGRGEARIAMDVGQDAVFFDNPDLPRTRSEMALPLKAGGRLLGALDVQSSAEAAFGEVDIATLQVLADQVAVAIENANLFAETQTALESTRRAYGESSRMAWEKILQARADLGYLCDLTNTTRPVGRKWQPEMLIAKQAQEMVKPDPHTVLLPVKINDQPAGVIRLRKPEASSEWTPKEIGMVEMLVEQLGFALENARLYEDTQKFAERERVAAEVSARIRESLDVDTVMQTAVVEMRRVLGLEDITIRLGDDNGQ